MHVCHAIYSSHNAKVSMAVADGFAPIRRWRRPVGVHDDVIKWKHFPRYWPFMRGIHRSPVNSPHKGQWRGALMFSLIYAWTSGWANNRDAGGLRRYSANYDVIVMCMERWGSNPGEGTLGLWLLGRILVAVWPYFLQGLKKGVKMYIFDQNNGDLNSIFRSKLWKKCV